MAVNAVIQKHSSLPGTPVQLNMNQSNQQPILISRSADGSLTPTITGPGNPAASYFAVGGSQVAGGAGLQTIIASGNQVIQGAPVTLSQLQRSDLAQTASGKGANCCQKSHRTISINILIYLLFVFLKVM